MADVIEKALYNELILSNIFKYLKTTDIKNCRLMNSTWADVGRCELKAVAYQRLFNPGCTCRQVNNPPKFLDSYSIERDANCHCKWSATDFASIIDTYIKDAQELSIFNLYGQPNEIMALSEIQLPNLKDLIVVACKCCMQFRINANHIKNVTNLFIKNCILDVTLLEKKLAPIKLKLDKVNIIPRENEMISINEFIDFVKSKRVILYEMPHISIDLTDVHKVSEVVLHQIKIENGFNINWEIKKLIFNMPQVTDFSFRHVIVEECQTIISINNLRQLPQSASSLKLFLKEDEYVPSDESLPFPFLRNLEISSTLVSHFDQVMRKISFAPVLDIVEFHC